MIVDNGIPVGMSSDGMQIAPMNPFIHAYYATTGLNALGNQINPGQQITRQELLELYTRDNQWFLGDKDEDLLGSLEVGRLGDVAVLYRRLLHRAGRAAAAGPLRADRRRRRGRARHRRRPLVRSAATPMSNRPHQTVHI